MVATAPEVQITQSMLDGLRNREIVDMEEASGVPMSAFQSGGTLPFKAVVALAWVLKRRDNPEYTFDDALDLEVSDMAGIFVPTQAAPLKPLKARRGSS